MRNGIEAAGVTVHRMNADFDTGDIAAQAPVVLWDGIDGVVADQIIATRGGELLVDVLNKLQHGALRYYKQAETATKAPWPTAVDFQLNLAWSAQKAFNFMRGTAEWQHPYSILVRDQYLELSHAVNYSVHKRLPTPYCIDGHNIQIQFAQGVLQAVTIETGLLTY
jgi:methionyl-tRNA formyltransferase